MRSAVILLAAIAAPAIPPASAREGEKPAADGGASREFVVEGKGGAYEVTVSPTYVTVFYLPDEVTQALASDQRNFSITVKKNTVVVRPVTDKKGLSANLNIDTSTLHISVILRVGQEAEAVSQVIFSRADERAEIDRRVEEEVETRLAPIRKAYEDRVKAFDAEVARAADQEIARRVLKRLDVKKIDVKARTDDNVIFAVGRAVRVGQDTYVTFTIQNRDDREYVLAHVVVTQGRTEFSPLTLLDGGAAETGRIGVVARGQRAAGVIVVPSRRLAPGKAVAIRFVRADGAELVVDDLRID